MLSELCLQSLEHDVFLHLLPVTATPVGVARVAGLVKRIARSLHEANGANQRSPDKLLGLEVVLRCEPILPIDTDHNFIEVGKFIVRLSAIVEIDRACKSRMDSL